MGIKIAMPKLSDTMTVGQLVKWRKREGDRIESGEIIAEAESDKATMELEAYDSGVLLKILVPEGGQAAVGATLAIIGEKGEDISALLSAKPDQESSPTPNKETSATALPTAPQVEGISSDGLITSAALRIKASPLARKLAAERGLDLRRISGSGDGGRIVLRDLRTAPAAPAQLQQTEPAQRVVPLSSMRATIANRLTQSVNQAPHFYLHMDINMNKAVELRAELNTTQNKVKISYNDMMIKAAALALTQHPYVNGSFVQNQIVLHERVDIGMAVALEDGLITPVVRNAAHKTLVEIAQETGRLADKARERKLEPDEYTGSTFTISNLGMYDIDSFTAIINPPEAAILAIGSVRQMPVLVDGQVVAGWRVQVTLSCDHRIVDGATGARFLQEMKRYLENPLTLLL